MKNSLIQHSRRRFMTGMLTLPFAAHAQALRIPGIELNKPRELSFYHTHTGKNLSVVYHDGESHLSPVLQEINHFLGDFRTGESHTIDKHLLDALYLLQQKTGVENNYEVISGYRSPKTNAKLRNKSNGVAKRSLHMQGKAIDVRLIGVNTKELRDTAIAMKLGGVGYYHRSDFVHLDTGGFVIGRIYSKSGAVLSVLVRRVKQNTRIISFASTTLPFSKTLHPVHQTLFLKPHPYPIDF